MAPLSPQQKVAAFQPACPRLCGLRWNLRAEACAAAQGCLSPGFCCGGAGIIRTVDASGWSPMRNGPSRGPWRLPGFLFTVMIRRIAQEPLWGSADSVPFRDPDLGKKKRRICCSRPAEISSGPVQQGQESGGTEFTYAMRCAIPVSVGTKRA